MDKRILHTLKTAATDNHGYKYTVTIRDGEGFSPIVSIDGTPGKWYMSTLVGHHSDLLSIDSGQNWTCTNWLAIAEEIGHTFY